MSELTVAELDDEICSLAARINVATARLLPLIRCEFGAGRQSYAKVRALTRIATEDTEADLVELAHAATAAQLERTVAGWRAARRGCRRLFPAR